MAKEKKEITIKPIKNTILSSINDKLIKSHPYAKLMNDPDKNKVTDWLHTGNYNLNMAVSGSFFKGWPNNTITGFAGPSGSGKTFLLLNTYYYALKKGYTIYHFDTEGAMTDDLIENFKLQEYVDDEKLVIIPINIIEDCTHLIHQIIEGLMEHYIAHGREGLPKVIIGLDSLGNLASRKEFEDAKNGEEKVDMTSAKKVRGMFRQITVPLSVLKVPMFVTNHTYEGTGMFAETKLSKGEGLVYACSNILLLGKAGLKDGETKAGLKVTARPYKNRLVQPRNVTFHIRFSSGMNQYVGLEQYILKCDDWNCNYNNIGIGLGKFDEKTNTFIPSKTNTGFFIKHLDKKVKEGGEFFSDKIFTKDVLQLMETYIKPYYEYSKMGDEENIDEDLNNELENELENEIED